MLFLYKRVKAFVDVFDSNIMTSQWKILSVLHTSCMSKYQNLKIIPFPRNIRVFQETVFCFHEWNWNFSFTYLFLTTIISV